MLIRMLERRPRTPHRDSQQVSGSRRPVRRTAALLVGLLMAGTLTGTVGASNAAADARPAAVHTWGGWTTNAADVSAVVRGTTATVRVTVRSSVARSALVDVEIYGSPALVHQRYWDWQWFGAGQTRTYTVSWPVPANAPLGTYVVKVGVFRPGWSSLVHWNNSAGSIKVVSGVSSTPTTAPTTTAAPTTAPTTTAAPTTTVRPTTTAAPTTAPTTTAAPTTAPTTMVRPTTTAAPTTVRPPSGRFVTLPPGSVLPGDAECAARVRPAAEIRPANATYNRTTGQPTSSAPGPLYARVTGNFTGTTDEIIQWAACKWGIDEDIVRAQTARESWWFQRATGDFSSDPSRCVPGHPIGADGRPGQCPESIGLQQVRYPYWGFAFPAATTSSAYNLDVAMAARRSCFEGYETWLNTVERGSQYGPGDLWGCIGTWFAGRWHTPAAEEYIAGVKDYLNQRIWETQSFITYTG